MFRALPALFLALSTVACVGAPRSATELDAMQPSAYVAWLNRVSSGAQAAGYEAARAGLPKADVVSYVAALEALAVPGAPMSPSTLVDVANRLGISLPIFVFALGEAQATITNANGWASPRVYEVIGTIALGLQQGVAAWNGD